jgi:hypothetical protein
MPPFLFELYKHHEVHEEHEGERRREGGMNTCMNADNADESGKKENGGAIHEQH